MKILSTIIKTIFTGSEIACSQEKETEEDRDAIIARNVEKEIKPKHPRRDDAS